MMHRRGLTLIEVLVSIVILSILAGTCVPLMRDSMRSLRSQPTASGDLSELAAFADDVMDRPADFGIDEWREVAELTLVWPEQVERSAVSVTVLRAPEPDIDHAWVLFTFNGITVPRWTHIEPEQAEEAQ